MNLSDWALLGDAISGWGGIGILILTIHTLRASQINQFKSEFWSSIDQKNRIIDKLKYSNLHLGLDAFNAYAEHYSRNKEISELGVYVEFCNHIFEQIQARDHRPKRFLNKLFILNEDDYVKLAIALFAEAELRLFLDISNFEPKKYTGVDFIVKKTNHYEMELKTIPSGNV